MAVVPFRLLGRHDICENQRTDCCARTANPMLRLTDLKLPLDHGEADLIAAILRRLHLDAADLAGHTVAKRSHDARKRGAIMLIYAVDVDTPREAELLQRFADDAHVQPTPDSDYHFVAQAPARPEHRPLVIGFGPCGLFAGLILAQMGFRPIILDRGKAAPARFPTASCTARSATRTTTAARCSPSSSRPARRRKSSTSASRTSAPSGW